MRYVPTTARQRRAEFQKAQRLVMQAMQILNRITWLSEDDMEAERRGDPDVLPETDSG